ncbi:aminotransferase class V-fold PLP-dependent enzyme [Marinactinospora thermotolerans]|uniref:aminotransferase class V-fold PLP-dependent enzyme n=1 Tax=Marinactinospora thermotolerans TaxID=531310 RepID=UPI003D8A81B6
MDPRSAHLLWDAAPLWLNTAQYGLPPRPAYEALHAALDGWRHGRQTPEVWFPAGEAARARFGELVGAPPQDVVQGAATSQLLSAIALAVPDGARVVIPDGEYTSNAYPWMVHADRGVKVVTVPPGELAAAIDSETWAVAFSLVSFSTGEIAPVDDIVAAARRHGTRVIVDGTQAVGWLPVDATRFDALVCSCYKWLMAPRGLAFGYLAPGLRAVMRPIAAGPSAAADPAGAFSDMDMRLSHSASRFDISPNWFAGVAAAASLGVLLDIGVERVHAHNVAMADRFRAGVGLPAGDSAIVSVRLPGGAERLREEGVRFSERSGRLRLSFHVYTTESDVDRAVRALTG